MKVEPIRIVGLAICRKHDREYQLLSNGVGCPTCQCEKVHRWAVKLIRDANDAHKKAANSKLVFG